MMRTTKQAGALLRKAVKKNNSIGKFSTTSVALLQKDVYPEPWKEKMVSFFRLFDVDRNDIITRSDYMKVIPRTRQLMSFHDAQRFNMIWAELWETHYLSVAEEIDGMRKVPLERFLLRNTGLMDGSSNQHFDQMLKWLEPGFDGVDFDNNGIISPDEYKVFLECFGASCDNVEASLQLLDTNGDGVIEKPEFLAMAKEYFRSSLDTRAKYFFGPLNS